VPRIAFGSDDVVIASGVVIVSEKVLVADCFGVLESVTLITTLLLVPATVGTPPIRPDALSMERPVGNPVADQLYGIVPPSACKGGFPPYVTLIKPAGNGEVVVMVSKPLIVNGRIFCAVEFVASVTVIVTLPEKLPLVVPLITAVVEVDEAIVNPAGRPVADQVYGGVPPIAVTVAL
jgi:hypothetical protein